MIKQKKNVIRIVIKQTCLFMTHLTPCLMLVFFCQLYCYRAVTSVAAFKTTVIIALCSVLGIIVIQLELHLQYHYLEPELRTM